MKKMTLFALLLFTVGCGSLQTLPTSPSEAPAAKPVSSALRWDVVAPGCSPEPYTREPAEPEITTDTEQGRRAIYPFYLVVMAPNRSEWRWTIADFVLTPQGWALCSWQTASASTVH